MRFKYAYMCYFFLLHALSDSLGSPPDCPDTGPPSGQACTRSFEIKLTPYCPLQPPAPSTVPVFSCELRRGDCRTKKWIDLQFWTLYAGPTIIPYLMFFTEQSQTQELSNRPIPSRFWGPLWGLCASHTFQLNNWVVYLYVVSRDFRYQLAIRCFRL